MEASRHDSGAEEQVALAAALAALEQTVGDREFVAELIGDFLAGLPAQLAGLRAASSEADGEALNRVAHTLKSNAATFGAERLAQACRELERAVRGDEPAETRALVEFVEAEAARAEPALAAARDERSA